MNYEEYMGQVTTAQVQNTKEDWSDYFTKQMNSVTLQKPNDGNKTGKKPTAASYMDMAAQVTIRPSHEAMMQMRNQQITQQNVESRLAEEMRMYNQEMLRRMGQEGVKPEAKPVVPENKKTVKSAPVEVPGTVAAKQPVVEKKKEIIEEPIVDEVIEKEVMNGDPAVIVPKDEEPVQKTKEEEMKEKLDNFDIFAEDEKEEEIEGIEFVPGGLEFDDDPVEEQFDTDEKVIDEKPANEPIIDEVSDDEFELPSPEPISYDEFFPTETKEEPAEVVEEKAEEPEVIAEEKPAKKTSTKKTTTKKPSTTAKKTTAKKGSTTKKTKK